MDTSKTHEQTARRVAIGLMTLMAVVALPGICVLIVAYSQSTWEFRYTIPAGQTFTDEVALEASRLALVDAGKSSNSMRPVSSGHKNSSGEEMIFARCSPNSGTVTWYASSRDGGAFYGVRVRNEDAMLVCTVSRHL